MTDYTPTIRNVLNLWRWANGPATDATVRIDWATSYNQSEVKRFLAGALNSRINRGAPVAGNQRDYPAPAWRKLDSDYQITLRRDAEKVRTGRGGLNPWRLFELPEISRRLPHLEKAHRERDIDA